MQPTEIEALIDDLRGCVIGEITLVAQDVHVTLETPRRELITLCCTQATILNAADQVEGFSRWAEWARTIDWAEVFGADTLGLTLGNGLQLFIRTTGAELTQCYGR
jgi:hypothetical protein